MEQQEVYEVLNRVRNCNKDSLIDYTDILVYAAHVRRHVILVSDNEGHWAVVDDNLHNRPIRDKNLIPKKPYVFTGIVEKENQWFDSPKTALFNYAKQNGWIISN